MLSVLARGVLGCDAGSGDAGVMAENSKVLEAKEGELRSREFQNGLLKKELQLHKGHHAPDEENRYPHCYLNASPSPKVPMSPSSFLCTLSRSPLGCAMRLFRPCSAVACSARPDPRCVPRSSHPNSPMTKSAGHAKHTQSPSLAPPKTPKTPLRPLQA